MTSNGGRDLAANLERIRSLEAPRVLRLADFCQVATDKNVLMLVYSRFLEDDLFDERRRVVDSLLGGLDDFIKFEDQKASIEADRESLQRSEVFRELMFGGALLPPAQREALVHTVTAENIGQISRSLDGMRTRVARLEADPVEQELLRRFSRVVASLISSFGLLCVVGQLLNDDVFENWLVQLETAKDPDVG